VAGESQSWESEARSGSRREHLVHSPVRLADTECTFLLQTNFDRVGSTAKAEFSTGGLTNLADARPNLGLFSAAAIAFLRIPFVATF
jgi:hypothetical protein